MALFIQISGSQLFENSNPTIEPGTCSYIFLSSVQGGREEKKEKERRMKEEEGGGQEERVRGREGRGILRYCATRPAMCMQQ